MKTGNVMNKYLLGTVGLLTLASVVTGCSGPASNPASPVSEDTVGAADSEASGFTLASGGGWSSGGGNGVVCFSDPSTAASVRKNGHQVSDSQLSKITSVESVDFLEAKLPQGFDGKQPEIVPIQTGETAEEYLEKVARRFDQVIPRISDFVRDGMAAFQAQNLKYQNVGVPFIDDANLMADYDRDNCALVTLARQYQINDSYVLRIDNRLASQMSVQSRAVLLLHEMIYRAGRMKGHTDSRNTRLLLGAMITQNDGRTVSQMLKLGSDLGFLIGTYHETHYQELIRKEVARILTFVSDLYQQNRLPGEGSYYLNASEAELKKKGVDLEKLRAERSAYEKAIEARANLIKQEVMAHVNSPEVLNRIRSEFAIFPENLRQMAENTLTQSHSIASFLAKGTLYWDLHVQPKKGEAYSTNGAKNLLELYIEPIRIERFQPELLNQWMEKPWLLEENFSMAGVCMGETVSREDIGRRWYYTGEVLYAEIPEDKRKKTCQVELDFFKTLDFFAEYSVPSDPKDLAYPIPAVK